MRIALAVIHGCFSSGVAALLDILQTAEARRGTVDGSIPPLEVRVLGSGSRVTSSSGMDLPVDGPLSDLGTHDVAVVPAMGTMTGDDTLRALRHPDARALVAALGDLAPTAHTVAAACTGVFPVAEAGWLARRRATTSWWLWPALDTSHAKNRTTTRLTNNRTRPTEAKRDDKSLRRFLILSTRLSFLDFLILSLYFRSMNY